MKNIIPFSKELDFKTKLSEITSISLEREFEVKDSTIEGNLFVTGDYKSHEVSANLIPFSFKIPFSIEIPDTIEKESISLEINDFAYDILEDSKIKVNIELDFDAKEKEEKEEEKENEVEILEEIPKIDPDEILEMMEEERKENEEEKENTYNDREEEIVLEEEQKEEINEIAEEDILLESSKNEEDDEYATYHIHMVKDGETVETICTMYHSNLNLLSDYNDLSNITPGSKLIVPSDDES